MTRYRPRNGFGLALHCCHPFGLQVILRAHNDNMIQVRDGKLTAYTKGRHAHTVFEFIGSTGVITNHRMFALKSAYGFVNTQTVGRQVRNF